MGNGWRSRPSHLSFFLTAMASLDVKPAARIRRFGTRIGHDAVWLGIAGLFFVVEGAVMATEVAARVVGATRPPAPPLPLRSRRAH